MKQRTKDVIQYGSAVMVLVSGIGLSIASFIVSLGQIHDSVLWFFAQCLMYSGTIFGVYVYVGEKFNRLKSDLINGKLNRENETNK